MMTMSKTSVTSGQKNEILDAVLASFEKQLKNKLNDLGKSGTLNKVNAQRAITHAKIIAEAGVSLAEAKIIELTTNMDRLKLISVGKEILLAGTDGTELISNMKDVFMAGIDSDFKNWNLDVTSNPTGEMKVQVYEQVKDSTFAQLFGSFGENLDRLCFTQGQIIEFVKAHSAELNQNWWNFFLFKVNGEFFVADVSRYGSGWDVRVYRFERGHVWHAENRLRFLVPQL
jgi:hypothetical protein